MRSASYNEQNPEVDQNQTMYVDVIRRFLSLIFRHKFIASPRATVRDIKNILAILRPQCLEIMFTEFGGNRVVIFRGVYQIQSMRFLNSPE